MKNNCPNCNQLITENFCANCGQKKYKRIDKKYIWEEIQYTVLHTNKGFLYSIKNIIKNPGTTAREFIDGNRINHYKPILLAFVISGIATFISFKIIGLKELMIEYYSKQHLNSQFMNDYTTFLSSYNSIIMLLLIPFFALITKLSFRKWGHNYYEHVVMNAYILTFYTIINIVIIYPVMYLLRSNIDLIISMSSIPMLILPFILAWFFKQFYKEKPLKKIISRVLLTIILTLIGFLIFFIFIMVCGFIYAIMNGPEALEYMKPQ